MNDDYMLVKTRRCTMPSNCEGSPSTIGACHGCLGQGRTTAYPHERDNRLVQPTQVDTDLTLPGGSVVRSRITVWVEQ